MFRGRATPEPWAGRVLSFSDGKIALMKRGMSHVEPTGHPNVYLRIYNLPEHSQLPVGQPNHG